MTEHSITHRRVADGFTLVELLVSMTVLSLIMVLVLQLFEGATRATTQSYRVMDINTEARLVLDRLGDDLTSMVRRNDIDYKLDKKSGNDALAFYAESSGYLPANPESPGFSTPTPSPTPAPRTLSTLDYRIHEGTASPDALLNFKLERGARATLYKDGEKRDALMVFSGPPPPYPAGSQTYVAGYYPFNTLPLIASNDYTVVGNQIFRLEFCYLLKNGKLSKTPNPPSDLGASADRPSPGGFKQVAALVVAVAMLDARNRVLLGDSKSSGYEDAFNRLVQAFPDVDPNPDDATSTSQDILAVWQTQLLKIEARTEPNTMNLPKPVTSNVHIFGRYYYWK